MKMLVLLQVDDFRAVLDRVVLSVAVDFAVKFEARRDVAEQIERGGGCGGGRFISVLINVNPHLVLVFVF